MIQETIRLIRPDTLRSILADPQHHGEIVPNYPESFIDLLAGRIHHLHSNELFYRCQQISEALFEALIRLVPKNDQILLVGGQASADGYNPMYDVDTSIVCIDTQKTKKKIMKQLMKSPWKGRYKKVNAQVDTYEYTPYIIGNGPEKSLIIASVRAPIGRPEIPGSIGLTYVPGPTSTTSPSLGISIIEIGFGVMTHEGEQILPLSYDPKRRRGIVLGPDRAYLIDTTQAREANTSWTIDEVSSFNQLLAAIMTVRCLSHGTLVTSDLKVNFVDMNITPYAWAYHLLPAIRSMDSPDSKTPSGQLALEPTLLRQIWPMAFASVALMAKFSETILNPNFPLATSISTSIRRILMSRYGFAKKVCRRIENRLNADLYNLNANLGVPTSSPKEAGNHIESLIAEYSK